MNLKAFVFDIHAQLIVVRVMPLGREVASVPETGGTSRCIRCRIPDPRWTGMSGLTVIGPALDGFLADGTDRRTLPAIGPSVPPPDQYKPQNPPIL